MANEVYRNGRIVLELPTGIFWGFFLAALMGSYLPVYVGEVVAEHLASRGDLAWYMLKASGWAGWGLLWVPVMHVLGTVVHGKQQEFRSRPGRTALLLASLVAAPFAFFAVRYLFGRLF